MNDIPESRCYRLLLLNSPGSNRTLKRSKGKLCLEMNRARFRNAGNTTSKMPELTRVSNALAVLDSEDLCLESLFVEIVQLSSIHSCSRRSLSELVHTVQCLIFLDERKTVGRSKVSRDSREFLTSPRLDARIVVIIPFRARASKNPSFWGFLKVGDENQSLDRQFEPESKFGTLGRNIFRFLQLEPLWHFARWARTTMNGNSDL